MAQKVEVIYQLVDRLSSKADRIQKKISKLESSLERVDRLTTDLGKNKGLQTFASTSGRSIDSLNKKLATTDKKLKTVNRSLDAHQRRLDAFNKSLEKANDNLAQHNKLLDEYNNQHKQGTSNAAVHARQQREFGNSLTPVTRKVNSQVSALGALDKAAASLQDSLSAVILKENKLGDAMARKNIHARNQIKNLKDVDRQANRTSSSMDRLGKSTNRAGRMWQHMQDTLRGRRDHSFFLDGFDFGAGMFINLRKIAAILPVIGVGFGGVAGMVAGATAAVGGLTGSVMKLSGALAVLPGMYAAVGITAASMKGISGSIFKPIMESKDALAGIDKQIANAQRSLSQAQARNAASTTPAGSRSSIAAVENAEARINELMKERSEISEKLPKDGQKLLDAVEKIKDHWREAWFGQNGNRATQAINDATRALTIGTALIHSWDVFFQRGIDTFSYMVDAASRLARNPFFMGAVASAMHKSFDNAKRMLNIAENLAPVTATIAENMTQVTSEVLDGVEGWSETYTEAEKIEKVQRKTLKWMREGVAQAKKWGKGLGDLGSALNTLTKPMADEFDKRFFGKDGVLARFDKWADEMAKGGDKSKLVKFSKNSFLILDAMGGVLLSLANVIGRIGSDKGATDATVEFLNLFAGGIEKFGGFALKAVKTLGPEFNDFFKAFGNAHDGSGDIIIKTLTAIMDINTKFIEMVNKIPYSDKVLGVATAIGILATALGGLVGTIAGVGAGIAGVVTVFRAITGMVEGFGAAAGAAGAMGKGAGPLQRVMGAFNPVAVTAPLHPTGAVMVWVMNPGGGGGGGVAPVPGNKTKPKRSIMDRLRGIGSKAGKGAKITGFAGLVASLGSVALEADAQSGLTKKERSARVAAKRAKFQKEMDKGFTLNPIEALKRNFSTGFAASDSLTTKAGRLIANHKDPSNRKNHRQVSGNRKHAEEGIKALKKNPFYNGTLPTTFDKTIAKSTKTVDKGLKNQARTVKTRSDQVGRAAVTPLARWVRRTHELIGSLNLPGAAAGSSSGSGGSLSVSMSRRASSGVTSGHTYGDSNRPVANRWGDSNRPAVDPDAAGLSGAMGPAVSLATRMGGDITSGLRPGAITSSGLPSDHATGNAIDVGGSPALMSRIAMAANSLPGVKQVIYSPVGWSRNGGPFTPVSDAAVKADHYDHVHIAMGGSGPGGPMPGGMPGSIPGLPEFPNTVMGQAVAALAQNAHGQLSQQFSAGGDPASMAAGAHGAGGSMQAIIQRAANAYGANPAGLLAVAQAESSLNPSAVNLTDSNALAGTPSRGLFQFIESTFNSMSPQAMAANPSAWAGVNREWLDPTAQALTAAWAFTSGQGSHWTTASHYRSGDGIGGGSAGRTGASTARPKVGRLNGRRGGGGGGRRSGGGGGNVFQTTVVVQGALFLDEAGREQLGDMVGQHVAKHVIQASPNASTETDI